MSVDGEVQRALGRLEGKADQILAEQKSVRLDLLTHEQDDEKKFALFEVQLEDLLAKLTTLNGYVDNAKGIWWFLGIVFACVAAIDALGHWLYARIIPHG